MARRTIFETETVADLYLKQGFKKKAAAIYERLYLRDPSNERLGRKLAELNPDSPALQGAAEAGEEARRKRVLLETLRDRILQRRKG